MTSPIKKMPTPLGVGAGQTASVQLPLGLTYERLYMEFTVDGNPRKLPIAEMGDYIDEVRLMVDGDTKIQIKASDLVKLNKFYGQNGKPGVLDLFLAQPWMQTIDGQKQTAYGTRGGLSSFALEMDLKSGKTFAKVDVYALQSPGTAFGPHLRIQRYVHNQGVTGEAEISDIMRGNYSMAALHVNTDEIEDVEIMWDNRKILETSKSIRAAHYDVTKRNPQAGFTHIDFLSENILAEALPMAVSDFRLNPTFTATGNFSIYAVSIQSPAT